MKQLTETVICCNKIQLLCLECKLERFPENDIQLHLTLLDTGTRPQAENIISVRQNTCTSITVYRCLRRRASRYTSQTTSGSSQPLMLLLAVVVYNLPTGTVSPCLAVDSARTAVERSTTPARWAGSRCQMNLEMQTVSIVLNGSESNNRFSRYQSDQRIRSYFIARCATFYLLIYLLTSERQLHRQLYAISQVQQHV